MRAVAVVMAGCMVMVMAGIPVVMCMQFRLMIVVIVPAVTMMRAACNRIA